MFTVMGMDPGTNNYAWSIVDYHLKPAKYEVVAHGMLQHPVKEMNGMDVGKRMKMFASEIRAIKREYGAQFAVAERYMTRGHGGTTIEAVSMMLGGLTSIFGNEICFLSAATWKNQVNKKFNLDAFYSELKPYGIAAHRIDAVCIGLYGATLALGEPHYQIVRNKNQLKKQILDTR